MSEVDVDWYNHPAVQRTVREVGENNVLDFMERLLEVTSGEDPLRDEALLFEELAHAWRAQQGKRWKHEVSAEPLRDMVKLRGFAVAANYLTISEDELVRLLYPLSDVKKLRTAAERAAAGEATIAQASKDAGVHSQTLGSFMAGAGLSTPRQKLVKLHAYRLTEQDQIDIIGWWEAGHGMTDIQRKLAKEGTILPYHAIRGVVNKYRGIDKHKRMEDQ